MIRFLDRWVPMWEFGAGLSTVLVVGLPMIVVLRDRPGWIANGIAACLAMVVSYLLHRRWANRRDRARGGQGMGEGVER